VPRAQGITINKEGVKEREGKREIIGGSKSLILILF
jgi:hypothetical protein